jgi:acetyl esterase/lipase
MIKSITQSFILMSNHIRSAAFILVFNLYLVLNLHAQHEAINIWEGKAPGSEDWNYIETIIEGPSGLKSIQNVVYPTITPYLPNPEIANGTSVLVCPGGGFRGLSWDSEGVRVAEWLNSKGIAAFILKYRVMQTNNSSNQMQSSTSPVMQMPKIKITNANANPEPENKKLTELIHMAISDAAMAMHIIRQHAAGWNLDPEKVGIMGFSAGGGVAAGIAMLDDMAAYPDFIVSVYGPSLLDVVVPEHAAPLFIAVGAEHPNVAEGCIELFRSWRGAGKSAEIHVFANIPGPFGISKTGKSSDTWPDLLYEWMIAKELVKTK